MADLLRFKLSQQNIFYLHPPRFVCELIILFISRLSFGLDFPNKHIYLIGLAVRIIKIIFLYRGSFSLLTFSRKDIFLHLPCASFLQLYNLYRGSSSLLTFSTKYFYLHPPCFVCELIK